MTWWSVPMIVLMLAWAIVMERRLDALERVAVDPSKVPWEKLPDGTWQPMTRVQK